MHIWELKIVKAKIKIWKSVKGLTRKMEETAKESVRMKRPNLKNREKADWKKWTKHGLKKKKSLPCIVVRRVK